MPEQFWAKIYDIIKDNANKAIQKKKNTKCSYGLKIAGKIQGKKTTEGEKTAPH